MGAALGVLLFFTQSVSPFLLGAVQSLRTLGWLCLFQVTALISMMYEHVARPTVSTFGGLIPQGPGTTSEWLPWSNPNPLTTLRTVFVPHLPLGQMVRPSVDTVTGWVLHRKG